MKGRLPHVLPALTSRFVPSPTWLSSPVFGRRRLKLLLVLPVKIEMMVSPLRESLDGPYGPILQGLTCPDVADA
jgi:hypothetical protein